MANNSSNHYFSPALLKTGLKSYDIYFCYGLGVENCKAIIYRKL